MATGSKRSGGSGSTKRYTVSFNTNGGNKITSQTVAKDNSVKEPTAPIKKTLNLRDGILIRNLQQSTILRKK